MFMTFWYPAGLNVAAIRLRAAFSWAAVISPSLTPLRSVAPDCIFTPVGRLDQLVLYSLVKPTLALARLTLSRVPRKALAAATARAVALVCWAPAVAPR